MIITDQKINDPAPYTLSVLIGTGSGWLRLKAVWMVVGLVPMSPNTTPSAPPKLQGKTGRLDWDRPDLDCEIQQARASLAIFAWTRQTTTKSKGWCWCGSGGW